MASDGRQREELFDGLRAALRTGELTLTLIPTLKKDPLTLKGRLNWWDELPDSELRTLRRADVDYYISSPRPLPEHNALLEPDPCLTRNEEGQTVYHYRLRGRHINPVDRNVQSFPIMDGVEDVNAPHELPPGKFKYTKFEAKRDPFFLFDEKARSAGVYGLGLVKIKDSDALVIRGQDISKLREQFPSSAQEIREWPAETTLPFTGIVSVPHELAESIRMAHGLAQSRSYRSANALFDACQRNPRLYAPALPTETRSAAAADAAAPRPEERKTDPAEMAAALPDALRAYHATMTARRRGNGTARYTVEMRHASVGDAPWGQYFPDPQRVIAYLAQRAGFRPQRQSPTAEIPRLRTDDSAHAKAVAALLGVTLDESMIQRFVLQPPRPDIARETKLYLLEENNVPCLVAVGRKEANEDPKDPIDIRHIFGIPPAVGKSTIETLPLRTAEEAEQGVRITHYYSKVPINPQVFDDLQASGEVPLLESPENIVEQIRRIAEMPAIAARQTGAAAPVIVHARQGEKTGPDLEELSRKREKALSTLLDQARGSSDAFYIDRIREGETVRPYAFAIMNPRQGRSLPRRMDAINEEAKPLARLTVDRVAGFGSGSGRRSVFAIQLTEEHFAAMEAGQRGRNTESRMLGEAIGKTRDLSFDTQLPVEYGIAQQWLQARAEEIVTDNEKRAKAASSAQLQLLNLLAPLSYYTKDGVKKGGVIITRLPSVETLDDWIATEKERMHSYIRWIERGGLPPETGASMERQVKMAQTMLADPSRLSPGSVRQAAQSIAGTRRAFEEEISRFERLRHIVGIYGRELPVLVIQGPLTRFNILTWNALKLAVDNPKITLEGQYDIMEERMHASAVGMHTLGKDSSALLRIHEISLPARGKDRTAAIMMMTPRLYNSLLTAVSEAEKEVNRIGTRGSAPLVVPDATAEGPHLNYVVRRHFVPETPDLVPPQSISELYRDKALLYRALIVNQRPEDSAVSAQAAPTLYLMIGSDNRAEAQNLLIRLTEEQYAGNLKSSGTDLKHAGFRQLKEEFEFLRQLSDECSWEYNHHITEGNTSARKMLGKLRKKDEPAPLTFDDSWRFDIGRVMEILNDPNTVADSIKDGFGDTEHERLGELVTRPIRDAITEGERDAVLSLLREMRAGMPIDTADERIDAFGKLLDNLPHTLDGLLKPKELALADQLKALLPEAERDEPITLRNFRSYIPDLPDAPAVARDDSTIILRISDADKPQDLKLDEENAATQISEALRAATNDKPLIIEYPLTDDFMERHSLEKRHGSFAAHARTQAPSTGVRAVQRARDMEEAGKSLDQAALANSVPEESFMLAAIRAYLGAGVPPRRGRAV